MSGPIRVCPRHQVEVVALHDLFPGSPCAAPFWCVAEMPGHSVRVWEVRSQEGKLLLLANARHQRAQPACVIARKRLYRVRPPKPAANHPWRRSL